MPTRFAIRHLLFAVLISPMTIAAADNPIQSVVARVSPAVVKLYGAAAGREHGYGTGLVISSDGKIVTTLSLLVSGRNLRVVTADGRRFDGRLLRTDESRQLALLQIDATDLPYLTPATSADLRIGDPILALGNCFKIAEGDEAVSVCRGILSAKLPSLQARRLAQEYEYTGPALVYDAITSNAGASGGPVLDMQGRVVGLVGKIVEASATNTRLNYAIPSEQIAEFLAVQQENTRAGEQARARSPGVGSRPPSSSPAPPLTSKPYVGIKLSELGYHHVSAFVERVRGDSPAAKAGIRPDDLIVAIDTTRITDAASFQRAVAELLPGQTAQFTIKRGAQVLIVPVAVGAEP